MTGDYCDVSADWCGIFEKITAGVFAFPFLLYMLLIILCLQGQAPPLLDLKEMLLYVVDIWE